MHGSIRILTVLAGVLLLAASAGAQGDASEKLQEHEKYFWVDTATVVSIDPEQKRLTVDDRHGQATYRIEDFTLIRKESGSVPLSALSEGDRITISAHEGIGGQEDLLVADTITVVIVDESGEPVSRSP